MQDQSLPLLNVYPPEICSEPLICLFICLVASWANEAEDSYSARESTDTAGTIRTRSMAGSMPEIRDIRRGQLREEHKNYIFY